MLEYLSYEWGRGQIKGEEPMIFNFLYDYPIFVLILKRYTDDTDLNR